MNPLLSNQNLFVLKTVNQKRPNDSKLMVINEFEGFYDYVENQMAVNIFGQKESTQKERTKQAREMLIRMIGKDEFMRLREIFMHSKTEERQKCSYKSLNEAERKIFKLIAKGFKQTEIAELMDWSDSEVEDHKERIYSKMNFAKKADLLDYASKNKLA